MYRDHQNRKGKEEMQNAQAKILATTYEDRMTITRKEHVKSKETHEIETQETIIYQDQPCALSIKGNNTPEKDSSNNRHTISNSYTIFTLPEVFCKAGDSVEIITQAGQIYKGSTGRSMRDVSHAEPPLKVEAVV